MRGKLIVFEGPDAVGKSTLVRYLRELLEQKQVPNESVSFPGDHPGTIGKLVYDLHHVPEKFGIESVSLIGLQALHIAAHLDAINDKILPAIDSGTWVVLDRFWWSTWVYGRASGIDPRVLDSLISPEKLLWGKVTPSVVFLIQRTEPFGDKPQGNEFATHSTLYRTLSICEAVNHEIVTMVDAEPEAANEIVRQWVSRNT
jgi:dTMP kinase